MDSFDNQVKKLPNRLQRFLTWPVLNSPFLAMKKRNSADTARRLGNEFLFQQLCQENIANFQVYDVKKIVTIDPHAYNTFKNEYQEFGLEAEVYHPTEVIHQLIKEGRIKPILVVDETIVYHDSCYIPREILKSISGIKRAEMERSLENSMCCGAGGGMMWLEETQGKQMNNERTEQALQLKPTIIRSNCPYCLMMLSDGVKAKEVEDQIQTLDIAENVERSLID